MAGPRIYCDFDAEISDGVYPLASRRTTEDVALLKIRLRPGLRITLYDCGVMDNGQPVYLLADAIVVDRGAQGLVAQVEPGTYRLEQLPESA